MLLTNPYLGTTLPVEDPPTTKPNDIYYMRKQAERFRALGLTIPEESIMPEATTRLRRAVGDDQDLYNLHPVVADDGSTRYQVPFSMDGFTEKERVIIRNSLDIMSTDVCLDFIEVSVGSSDYTYAIAMFKGNPGTCYSYVGRTSKGHSPLSLGQGCAEITVVQHEVMHALGILHEQSRPDRDGHVLLHKANIIPDKLDQYGKFSQFANNFETPYDLLSIMHYGGTFFTIGGMPSMTYKKQGVDTGKVVVSNPKKFSSMDVYEICKLYNCDRCANQEIPSYEGTAYKSLMHKCMGPSDYSDRYYWSSRCNDGFYECDWGDDENPKNDVCTTAYAGQ